MHQPKDKNHKVQFHKSLNIEGNDDRLREISF